jgi:phage terminase large subunit GpA-like protein
MTLLAPVLSPETAAASVAEVMRGWRPPARLDLSDWAERYFYLSPESAAEPRRSPTRW